MADQIFGRPRVNVALELTYFQRGNISIFYFVYHIPQSYAGFITAV